MSNTTKTAVEVLQCWSCGTLSTEHDPDEAADAAANGERYEPLEVKMRFHDADVWDTYEREHWTETLTICSDCESRAWRHHEFSEIEARSR